MTATIYNLYDSIIFRKATIEDIETATKILRLAARQMMNEGKQQWDDNYPTASHVRADVERGVGYVLEQDEEVIGYCSIMMNGEPAYKHIQGKWLSDSPYIVVHRMAIRNDKKGMGLGRLFLAATEKYARDLGLRSFKVDTNFDNVPMLSLLKKLGFTYCGEIYYAKGRRKAFEKLLT